MIKPDKNKVNKMNGLRIIIGVMFVAITTYTMVVVFNHGFNLIPIFFGDLIALNWSGQFNLDFAFYLILSALWIAWRHQFSRMGIVLGLIASVAGMIFFALYVLVAMRKADGDIRKLLLGERKA